MSDEKSAAGESGDKNNPILLDDEDDMRLRDPDDAKGSVNKLAVAISNDECPYMDTIDRRALDFDFEKLCSVSLSKVNVYACLVCGKYFQGRGKASYAFIHSVSVSHHVFLNLETFKFYCLPDNYEISHPSLQDILHVLRPVFTQEEIDSLDKCDKPITAQDGKSYYPGIVGLNNLKHNDYCSVIFQALSHVVPLRDYFLVRSSQHATSKTKDNPLARRFGELLCKLWNPRAFKPHVSPHEMLQAIVLTSKKRFEFTKQGDPIVFLGWLLNSLLGPKRTKDNIIKRTFQGKIQISTRLLLPRAADDPELVPAPEEDQNTTSFLYLTLDLPTMPLFPKKDKNGKVIKPRVSIYDLLKKFDSKTKHEFRTFQESSIKRYEILQLPRYLILYYKRFSHNSFSVDKNTHIVDFTIKDLNMTHLVTPHWAESIDVEPSQGDRNKTVNGDGKPAQEQHYRYRLLANIVHDGEPEAGKGTYRAQILHLGTGKWFELQDLYVTEVADNMLITFSEPYIQIWELKDS